MKLSFNPPNYVDLWDPEERRRRNVEVNSLEDILTIPWLQKYLQDPQFEQIVYVHHDFGHDSLYQLYMRYKNNDGSFQHDRIYNCDGDPSIFGIKNIKDLSMVEKW